MAKLSKPARSQNVSSQKKSNDFNFSNISTLIENISKKDIISIEDFEKEKTFISTGIHILDALLSKSVLKGGIPNNKITIIAGPKQTGKSFISLNIARNAQKMGYNIVWIDTEYSIEKTDFDMYGIDTSDPNKFMLIRTNIVEKIKMFMMTILDGLQKLKDSGIDVSKTIFFIDSIGMLSSEKEKEDTLKLAMKQDMTRAKQIKSLVRLITNDLGYLNIPLVATNHTYLCLTEGHEVIKADGNFELIENLIAGDYVKTLDGDKKVLGTFKYPKSPIIQITLENGEKIKCTPQHKFLVKRNWTPDENNECWKKAEELTENDIILSISEDIIKNMRKFKEIKIAKVEYLEELETTYDVQIEGSHHYILKSGIISHNTQDMFPQTIMSGGEGLYYASSVILLLSDAKLTTGEEDQMDLGRSGSVITAKSAKNRLAKPKKVKFEIDYSKGINPYKGLDLFCTPENFDKIGIAKVKKVVDKETGEIIYQPGNRWYVKHLDKSLAEKQLFNRKVFTSDILNALEPIIYDYFKYPSYDECLKELEDIDEKLNEIEEKDMMSSEYFNLDDDNKLFE